MHDGNQLKWKVQYNIIYNNINTEIVICNVNVQYAMLLQYITCMSNYCESLGQSTMNRLAKS